MKTLSYVDFSSACNCIATLAIARSQLTDILYLLHFSATFSSHLSVSSTTDVNVGDSFFCFKYQTFCVFSSSGPYLEFQPIHIGTSPDCLLNVRPEVQRKLCCCAFFKKLGTLVCLSSIHFLNILSLLCFIKKVIFQKDIQRCLQNLAKHLRWSVLQKQLNAVNFFCIMLHFRCLIGFQYLRLI